jgi:hypothetical protein
VGFADRIDSADSAITKRATGSRVNPPVPDTHTSSLGCTDLDDLAGGCRCGDWGAPFTKILDVMVPGETF